MNKNTATSEPEPLPQPSTGEGFAASDCSTADVESETCGECDRGRVPTWDGDGNETGDEPCQRCDGTGVVEPIQPQPNAKVTNKGSKNES